MTDGLGKEEDHGCEEHEAETHGFRKADPAQAENGVEDEQLQETASDIGEARGRERGLGCFSRCLQEESQIGDRYEKKDERDMHVEILLPEEDIDAGENHGEQENNQIVRLHGAPPRSGRC